MNGNRLSDILVGTIVFEGYRFAVAICMVQYTSFDMISSLYVLLNRFDGGKGALLLPKAVHAFPLTAVL